MDSFDLEKRLAEREVRVAFLINGKGMNEYSGEMPKACIDANKKIQDAFSKYAEECSCQKALTLERSKHIYINI